MKADQDSRGVGRGAHILSQTNKKKSTCRTIHIEHQLNVEGDLRTTKKGKKPCT